MSPDSDILRRLSKYSFPDESRASMLINANCDRDPSGLLHITVDFPVNGSPGFGGTYRLSAPGSAATSGFCPAGRILANGSCEGRELAAGKTNTTPKTIHETHPRTMANLQEPRPSQPTPWQYFPSSQ